jgi:HK97 family phage major capsid protein
MNKTERDRIVSQRAVSRSERSQELRANLNHDIRHIMNGRKLTEIRALTVSADASFLLPKLLAAPKLTPAAAGAIYDLVRVDRVTGTYDIPVPLCDDTAGVWTSESSFNSSTQNDPVFNSTSVNLINQYTQPLQIDASLVQDSNFDLVQFIGTVLETRYKLTLQN